MSSWRAVLLGGVGAFALIGAALVVRQVVMPADAADSGKPAAAPRSGTAPTAVDLVRASLPSIARISTLTSDSQQRLGTGFVVDSRGFIATNRHVVADALRIDIEVAGHVVTPVGIIDVDPQWDVVLLVVMKQGLPALRLRVDRPVEPGESVMAIGNPLGLDNTVTEGIVSAIRPIPDVGEVIQTSAGISPGNSGGPLLDASGEVMGIVTFKISGERSESLAFAIPAERISALVSRADDAVSLDDYIRGGRQPGDRSRGVAADAVRPRPSEPTEEDSLVPVSGTWQLAARTFAVLEELSPLRVRGELISLRSEPDPNDVLSGFTPGNIEERRPFILDAATGSALSGTIDREWSCQAKALALRDGRYRPTATTKTCRVSDTLQLTRSRGPDLVALMQVTALPEPSDPRYSEMCSACGGWSEQVRRVTWRRVSDETP